MWLDGGLKEECEGVKLRYAECFQRLFGLAIGCLANLIATFIN